MTPFLLEAVLVARTQEVTSVARVDLCVLTDRKSFVGSQLNVRGHFWHHLSDRLFVLFLFDFVYSRAQS